MADETAPPAELSPEAKKAKEKRDLLEAYYAGDHAQRKELVKANPFLAQTFGAHDSGASHPNPS